MMIWTSTTHRFTTTTCRHTGRECPGLTRMAEHLAEAMATARPVTADTFELEGNSALMECPHPCAARFHASHERVRIFCDVGTDAAIAPLDRFADDLLRADGLPVSGLPARLPCALAEAVILETGASRSPQSTAAATA